MGMNVPIVNQRGQKGREHHAPEPGIGIFGLGGPVSSCQTTFSDRGSACGRNAAHKKGHPEVAFFTESGTAYWLP